MTLSSYNSCGKYCFDGTFYSASCLLTSISVMKGHGRTEPEKLSPAEVRIAGTLILAGVLGTQWISGPAARPEPEALQSHTALRVARDVQTRAESLAYDDPRLDPTEGFSAPDATLRNDSTLDSGYDVSWRILGDQPARWMKTIEVRVRWPRADRPQELSIVSIKTS